MIMTEKDKNNYKFNEIQKRRLEISKVKKLLIRAQVNPRS